MIQRLTLGIAALLPAAMLVAVNPCNAQALAQPRTVTRSFDVEQFGRPVENHYVFCDGRDCPARTRKTLPAPQAALLTPSVPRAPAPDMIVERDETPVAVSQAKTKPKPKHTKKLKQPRKSKGRMVCRVEQR